MVNDATEGNPFNHQILTSSLRLKTMLTPIQLDYTIFIVSDVPRP